tara:strand:- start:228 stop:668 length:441 start_codon:yes stop_codon:yes gene_type:complete
MWNLDEKVIRNISDLPLEDHTLPFGFVYIIENLDNKRLYIGKKQLVFSRKVKKGKKELILMKDKRRSKFKTILKESDWLDYTGSSKELGADIDKGHKIIKTIIDICYSRSDLSYSEARYLFRCDVLNDKRYYNKNILGKFYRKEGK